MAARRGTPRIALRSTTAALFALVALVSCSGGGEPATTGVDDPLAARVDEAVEIARQEWDAPWILDLASSRYTAVGDDLVLDDHAYVFVSDDGAASYYLVRFRADGTVGSGPVAGMADFRPEAFDFGVNTLSSVDALDVAWDRFGESLIERCGPLRWLDVRGTRGADGTQWWSVDYRIGGQEHTFWLDAVTGAVGDIDQQPC